MEIQIIKHLNTILEMLDKANVSNFGKKLQKKLNTLSKDDITICYIFVSYVHSKSYKNPKHLFNVAPDKYDYDSFIEFLSDIIKTNNIHSISDIKTLMKISDKEFQKYFDILF